MRADVPESTALASPRGLPERIPGLEDRSQHHDARPVPALTVDVFPEPGGDTRIEATGEEDDRGSSHGLNQPVGGLDRESQRLLEQQRAPGFRGANGQLGLDVGRNRERDGIDRFDQVVEVGERLRAEPGRQRRRLGLIPTPDADQLGLRMRRDPRRMRSPGPVAGADQTEPDQPMRTSFLLTNSSAP